MTVTAVSQAQVIIDWALQAGWDGQPETGYLPLPGPEIVDEPDRALFITVTTGPGFLTEEGSADGWGFQARIRGPQDDPREPLAAAQQFDAMVLGANWPAVVDGVTIVHIHRLGSPPVSLPLDPASRRFECTASYIAVTGPQPWTGV